MARKRSVSGRSRKSTIQNKIYIQASKINRKLRSLKRGGNLGKYTSKELIQFAGNNPYLSVRNTKGSKKPSLLLSNLKKATFGQLTLIQKKFKQIIGSKGFSNAGIKKIREVTRGKVANTLKGIVGRDLSNKDLDLFYEIIKYKSDELIQKIGVSEFYALVMEAKENNSGVEEWSDTINNYVDINNDYMGRTAEYLFYKFVG